MIGSNGEKLGAGSIIFVYKRMIFNKSATVDFHINTLGDFLLITKEFFVSVLLNCSSILVAFHKLITLNLREHFQGSVGQYFCLQK